MYNTTQDLLDAFRATPVTLAWLLREDHRQDGAARPGPEAWSLAEIVCHLRDVEEMALERMRLMRDHDNAWLAAYDQDALAVTRNYAGTAVDEALAAFVALRRTHSDELAALPAGGWERTGRHEELGQVTISSHTLHLVSHDAVHLAQIARVLEDSGRDR